MNIIGLQRKCQENKDLYAGLGKNHGCYKRKEKYYIVEFFKGYV